MTDTRAPLERGYALEEFVIEHVVGFGGFGMTYLARDVSLDRPVAIKEYFPKEAALRDASLRIRPIGASHESAFALGKRWFLDEARMVASFQHPNIVEVYQKFEAHNSVYMALRLIDGQCLSARLRQWRPRQKDVDLITQGLVSALSYVHDNGLLHCDVSADNVMIRKEDGSPVLIDFGGARHRVARHSRNIAGVVKAFYSPPEQYDLERENQGPWSDIYSLGAVLYKCVTGNLPPLAISRVFSDKYVSAVQAARPGFRPEFLVAIDRALMLNPTERPQSMSEFSAELFPRRVLQSALPPPLPRISYAGPIPSKAKSVSIDRHAALAVANMHSTIASASSKRRWLFNTAATACVTAVMMWAMAIREDVNSERTLGQQELALRDAKIKLKEAEVVVKTLSEQVRDSEMSRQRVESEVAEVKVRLKIAQRDREEQARLRSIAEEAEKEAGRVAAQESLQRKQLEEAQKLTAARKASVDYRRRDLARAAADERQLPLAQEPTEKKSRFREVVAEIFNENPMRVGAPVSPEPAKVNIFQKLSTFVVNHGLDDGHLNLRAGPGTGERILLKLKPGAALTSLQEDVRVDTSIWTKVRFNDTDGWVSKRFVTTSQN